MSTGITIIGETRDENFEYHEVDYIFFSGYQSYALYGFLADVRNLSKITPISEPRGLPDDASHDNNLTFDPFDIYMIIHITVYRGLL